VPIQGDSCKCCVHLTRLGWRGTYNGGGYGLVERVDAGRSGRMVSKNRIRE
jgi:hypothetical protein